MRSICLVLVAIAACGNPSPASEEDMGSDASASDARANDTGARDSTASDGGSGDPCFSDRNAMPTAVRALAGCNGPGPTAAGAPNTFGGLCVPGSVDHPEGSCAFPNARCLAADRASFGLCVQRCTLSTGAYTSTSACPRGARCFDIGADAGACFPDCSAGASCASNLCDPEGACGLPTAIDASVPTDSGVSDGGVSDGGDAAQTDASIMDAQADAAAHDAAAADASPSMDGGLDAALEMGAAGG